MSLRCHLHGSVRNRPTVPAPRFNAVVEAYFFSADLMSVGARESCACSFDHKTSPTFLQRYSFNCFNNDLYRMRQIWPRLPLVRLWPAEVASTALNCSQ